MLADSIKARSTYFLLTKIVVTLKNILFKINTYDFN